MNKIRIAEVESKDAEFLYELMNNEAVMAVLNEVPTTVDVWKEAVAEWKQDDDEKDYIIFEDASPIGWLGINGLAAKDKTAYIKMIALLPQYQNNGIGQCVIDQAIEKLRSMGYTFVGLYTDKSNIKAQRCYLKCGFEIKNETEQKMSNGKVVKRYRMECRLKDK